MTAVIGFSIWTVHAYISRRRQFCEYCPLYMTCGKHSTCNPSINQPDHRKLTNIFFTYCIQGHRSTPTVYQVTLCSTRAVWCTQCFYRNSRHRPGTPTRVCVEPGVPSVDKWARQQSCLFCRCNQFLLQFSCNPLVKTEQMIIFCHCDE